VSDYLFIFEYQRIVASWHP